MQEQNTKSYSTQKQQIKILKNIIRECKEIIISLKSQNTNLNQQLIKKKSIILQLAEQKQSHMLHKISCNSAKLQDQIQRLLIQQNRTIQKHNNVVSRYQQTLSLITKQNKRLQGYNNALKIHIQQLKSINSKERRIGSISYSNSKKQQYQMNTQKTYYNPQQVKYPNNKNDKNNYLITPQKRLDSFKSTQFQSTALRSFGKKQSSQFVQYSINEGEKHKKQQNKNNDKQVKKIIRRLTQILDDDSD